MEDSKMMSYSSVAQLATPSSSQPVQSISRSTTEQSITNLGCIPKATNSKQFFSNNYGTNRISNETSKSVCTGIGLKFKHANFIGQQPTAQQCMYAMSPSKYNNQQQQQQQQIGPYGNTISRNRYMPYQYGNRVFSVNSSSALSPVAHKQLAGNQLQQQQQHHAPISANGKLTSNPTNHNLIHDLFNNNHHQHNNNSNNNVKKVLLPPSSPQLSGNQNGQATTLQISNLDYTLDENNLRNFLLNQLKPLTPVVSLVFESGSCARVTVPDMQFAKQVISSLHRKKIGHKRIVVSYTRDSSLTEFNTLRCQVAGLLKDVPCCTLPMYKFRELFQSRFKTSISVLDLYKMNDICTITADKNDEKYITLLPDLMKSFESSTLLECLQHSVPYCTIHFRKEQHKGWAEQDIEPLPNVFMTINELSQIVYPLLKKHHGDIPIASLIHCIQGELDIQIIPNDNGVNLEHLICCVNGIQTTTNSFGIKILAWIEPENTVGKSTSISDAMYQFSREVIELVKMCPKSTMKFNRFIPAYHNHFGKQCRVADYGYTKLIELFEALSSIVQVMGDGENRQITLTHRTQIRRFTTDLLRILRTQGNKSILLSQLPHIFALNQNRNFDVTEYGVCDIVDLLDGLVNSNIVVLTTLHNSNDILISIPKRKQTSTEIEKTSIFAGECIELLRNAAQYSIQFQKFVRSYHYHFGYQCRLSDYGFMKLADLMESIQGVVEIEYSNDEDKKIYLTPIVARRIFAEQLGELILEYTGSSKTCVKLEEILDLHKKKFGYKMQSQILGADNILDAIKNLPYIELLENNESYWIICHFGNQVFRTKSYKTCKIIQECGKEIMQINEFKNVFSMKYNENISDHEIVSMKHAIEIIRDKDVEYVGITKMMQFLIQIIGLLDKRFMSLSEIKSALRINLGDCYQFGYPNLFTLLRAYPDIFVIHLASTPGKNEIGLVSKMILTPNNSSKLSRHGENTSGLKPILNKRTGSGAALQENDALFYNYNSNGNNFHHPCQPLGPYNQRPLKMMHYGGLNCDLNNMTSQQHQEFMKSDISNQNTLSEIQNYMTTSRYNNEQENKISQYAIFNTNENIIKNNGNNKENTVNGNGNISNGSLNSSSGSELNSSYNSLNNDKTKPSTWFQSLNTSGNNIQNDFTTTLSENQKEILDGILNFTNPCNYSINNFMIPPKPDTPPLNENMPFWIDPIWSNNNKSEDSYAIDSLNHNSSEQKPFELFPELINPYSLSKYENMKNVFSQDKLDIN